MEDFRDYLEAVCQTPRLRGTCSTYVETEIVDRLRLSKLEEEFDLFGNFDMGLMVQNVVLEEKLEPEKKPEPEENSELEENLALREKPLEEKKPKETVETLPVLEGICKYAAGHVLLVGRPGSGKTTALERLLVQEAEAAREDSSDRIPVLIRLRDVRSTVLEQIRLELQHYGLRLGIEQLGDLLWAGRFLVLLDGVNELPSGEMRREVESFRREYQQKTPMIFTTRELNVGLDLGIEKKLEMQPLNERQMQEFTCRYLGQEQGQQLIKGLGQRLREFGQTPLLLWMLCGIYRKEREIPTNLGGVFKLFADIYNKNRFDNQKSSEYSRFLQQLAWAMMPQNDPQGLRLSIPRSEAEEIFREFRKAEQEGNALSGAIATLDELLRFHLLRPKDNQEVEFVHQLFQEYYAGEYLLSRLPKLTDLELQKCYLNYLDWTEAVALMAGLVGDRSQAVRLVNLGLEVDLMLGARLAGEVLPQFQEETVGLVTNLDLPMWLKVGLWQNIRSDKALDKLIKALQDQDQEVLRRAAGALGNIDSDRAIDALIKTLQDQNSDVCSTAAWALGKIGSVRAVDALIKTLKDRNGLARSTAAKALGNIGSDQAVDSLILALQDKDWDVRSDAALALINIGSDRAVDSLILALQDQNSDVRWNAAWALGDIGSVRAVDALIKTLKDRNGLARSTAAKALGNIGSDQAVDSLILALQDKDSYVRSDAALALRKIGSDRAVDSLILALQDQDWDVRQNAVEALGDIGSDRAVDSLILALQDRNWDARWRAAWALKKIGSDQAVDSLILALQDRNWDVRQNVLWALSNIGSDRAVDSLILALQDRNWDVRWNAAWALRKIGSDRAVDSLTNALQDQNDYVQVNIAETLGNIGSDNLISQLCNLISLLWQICLLQTELAFNAIFFAIKAWKNRNLRRNKKKIVENIHCNQNLDNLIKALQDQNDYVQVNIAETLGNIGSDNLISQLWQICRSGTDLAFYAILKIQKRYKLYNYEISQTPLPAITPTPSSVTYNIAQAGQIIQTLNVTGNNTGIQNL